MGCSRIFFNKYAKDIYNEDDETADSNIGGFPSLSNIYVSSKIDWEWLFRNVSMLSIETSNTMQQLEDMEFFKFDKLLYYVNDYLEKKNEGGSNENANDEFSNMKSNMAMNMSSMKNSMKPQSMKIPKM